MKCGAPVGGRTGHSHTNARSTPLRSTGRSGSEATGLGNHVNDQLAGDSVPGKLHNHVRARWNINGSRSKR